MLAWPLAAAPLISEFMAENKTTLADQDGQFSDWIEVFNPGPDALDLGGFHLTDEPDFPAKWRFPQGVVLAAGEFKIVFASGKDRTNAASELHANFQLSKEGEYLALVAPDGLTVLQAFHPYPPQREDVSFGPGRAAEALPLVTSNTLVRVLVPMDDSPGLAWTGGAEPFEDSAWLGGFLPLGYDNGVGSLSPLSNKLASAGFAYRYEMDAVGYTQDLDANGATDWATNAFPAVSDGMANGTNSLVCDANFTNSIWRAQFGTNFTVEFGVQVLTNGTEGAYGTLSLTASKGNNVAPWLNIKRAGQSWGTVSPVSLGSDLNTDAQHVFRLARDGTNCWVWRDDVLLNPGGQPLAPSTTIGAGTNALLLGDNSLNGNNGTWKLDFLRLQPGAYAPNTEPNLFGSLIRLDLRSTMPGSNASAYVRIPFAISEAPALFSNLVLRVRYDDGFVAYLNGVEVTRRNAPASPGWNSASTTNRTDALAFAAEVIDLSSFSPLLAPGTNVLAFQALNSSASAARFLLGAELDAVRVHATNVFFVGATPGTTNTVGSLPPLPKVQFSLDSQLFTTALTLTLSNEVPGATIYYTRNGAAPNSTNSTSYTGPITITNSVQVRAVAVLAGCSPSPVKSESFVKLAADLASFASPLPIVVLHNFGAGPVPGVDGYGPYRDGSFVVQVPKQPHALTILDRGTNGFTTFTNPVAATSRAGLRLRGSSSISFPRKPYTLETWTDTDEEGRDLPLLGLPSDNDWLLYGPSPSNYDDVLIHNSFIFELARQSGYYAPRTRFVEVFLNTNGTDLALANNLGLYLLMEKVKRSPDRVNFDLLSTDGTQGGWMLAIDRMDALPEGTSTNSGLVPRHFHTAGPDQILQTEDDNQRGYQTTSGGSGLPPPRDDLPGNYNSFFNFDTPDGWEILSAQRTVIQNYVRAFDAALYSPGFTNPVTGYAPFIDSENFAHHYILQNFPKNADCILLSTYLLREDPASPLKFGPIWDFDRAFNKTTIGSTSATNELYYASRMFYPRLFADPDFRQAYIDKWQQLRRGAFATSNLLAIVDAQVSEITPAVAARSGTTAVAWSNNLATFKTWLQQRALALDGQFLQMPVFSQDGGAISNGFTVTLTNLNAAGTLFFTLDGSDPRARGGSVAPGAQAWPQSIIRNATTVVRARVQSGTNWSGLAEAVFHTPQDFGGLALTEIMFNPPDVGATNGDAFEFLELKNTGTNTLNLSGLAFTAGITFTFTNGTLLAPGQFFVLVRNTNGFAAKYPGIVWSGIYGGKLDNAGERLALSTALGTPVFSVAYDDKAPWPIAPDGYGFSLVPKSPGLTQAPDDGAKWRASTLVGGSPGADDPAPTLPAVVINEVLSHPAEPGGSIGYWPLATGYPTNDAVELWNPTGGTADLSGWFLTDDANFPKKFRIPDGTVVPSGGLATFNECDFNPTPGTNLSFSFSSLGETVYLFSADTNGSLTGYSHGFAFGAAARGVSFGRHVNSVGEEQFPAQLSLTLGGTNAGPRVGPVVFSEIMYHPPTNGVEFIELANITDFPVPLFDEANPTNTWRLSGAGFSFPTNFILPPRGLVLVVATNETAFRAVHTVLAEVPVLGPFAGTLQDSGERLKLERPDLQETNGTVPYIVVDEVRYNDKAPWPAAADGAGDSLHRLDLGAYADEPDNWTASAPSPGWALDSDADALPDWWESAHGLDPNNPADASLDPDGDGLTNSQEFLAGTNPRSAASVLRLEITRSAAPNQLRLGFTAAAGRSYLVQACEDLNAGTWNTVFQWNTFTNTQAVEFSDSVGDAQRFYRLVTPRLRLETRKERNKPGL